jgi:AcrB/AcrD/AcrF family
VTKPRPSLRMEAPRFCTHTGCGRFAYAPLCIVLLLGSSSRDARPTPSRPGRNPRRRPASSCCSTSTWPGRSASRARRKSPAKRSSPGTVKRIRPKIMTVATILLGLVHILWSTGTGADVMKRIAAPMVGGVVISALLELLVYPRCT